MKTKTSYEWVLLELTEDDDILENHFCSSLTEALRKRAEYAFKHSEITLKCEVWNVQDECRDDVTWADYDLSTGQLSSHFDNGVKVPKKYVREAADGKCKE